MISLWKQFLQAFVILALTLAATLAAWRWTAQQAETLESIRFHQIADEAVNELRDRMDGYNQLLLSGSALLEASDEVTRQEWKRFIVRLDLAHRYPGTQGVGYAIRVKRQQWSAHEREIRAEGFPDYAIRPQGVRDEAFPIVFIEPFSGRNLRAFGYDMFSEPVRHAAMARARATGQPTLTGKVVLVQEAEGDEQPGVLLYLPYYDAHVLERSGPQAALLGFVYSPLRMGDLVRGVLGARLGHICFQIYDGGAESGGLLFANAECKAGRYASETHVDMFGRQWILRVQSTPGLDDEISSRRSKFILGAGGVISVLLVWAVMSMQAERRRRLALVRALADLEVARAEAAGAAAAKGRF
ncbi:MAG TPA: CHASE domain-containing protein, partial [Magnetospirillum sp.]|nr:CHASE domain-containing protein [Magnetospirillum sp.]